MANKRNKRKPSYRGRGRPRKKSINANLRQNEVGPKRRIEMMRSRCKSFSLTDAQLQEVRNCLPAMGLLKWENDLNQHSYVMDTGPDGNQAPLAFKVLEILRGLEYDRIRPSGFADSTHDPYLGSVMVKKSGDTAFHADNMFPLTHRDIRSVLIRTGGEGKMMFQVQLGKTTKNTRVSSTNFNNQDHEFIHYDVKVGDCIMFPSNLYHEVKQENGERIVIVFSIEFSSERRSGRGT